MRNYKSNATAAYTNSQSQFFVEFICEKPFRFVRHFLPVILLWVIINPGSYTEQAQFGIRILALLFFLIFLYCNIYILIPVFLFKARYTFYAIGAAALIAASFLIISAFDIWLNPYLKPGILIEQNDINDIVTYSVLMGLLLLASTATKLFQRWLYDTSLIGQLENINLRIELEQLKSQVSPHFLFNTLNNVNVLIGKDPERASSVLFHLSDLLRYQLYDGERKEITLDKEISFLNDFLELARLRRDQIQIELLAEGDLRRVTVPPLLFITFIENAIKHNCLDSKAYIHIRFWISDAKLLFTCNNSISATRPSPPEVGGIGLANIRRRLDLLYGNQYELKQTKTESTYTATLLINL